MMLSQPVFFRAQILDHIAILNIYINDFIQASNFFSLRFFADATSLTASHKNIEKLLLQIQKL